MSYIEGTLTMALLGAVAAAWCACGLAWLGWLRTSRLLRRFLAGPPPTEAQQKRRPY